MRYQESKQQSAELLRQAIALMGQHDATYNPVTFTVWYEFAAGMNNRLKQGIEEAIQTKPRLGDADLVRLYQQFVAEVDPAAMQRISSEFQLVMSGMLDSVSRTGDHAGAFDQKLRGLNDALSANDTHAMTPLVREALVDSQQMRSSAQALEQQVIASRREIERLQLELTRVRDEAVLDPLTRVLNRKGFDQRLASLMAQPPADALSHCLIMLDIDHFKKVNDTHGHVMGDRVIQALGDVLRAYVPATQPQAVAARYGGEEFAILLTDSTLEHGVRLADTVRQRVRAMKVRDRRTQEVVLTVSVSGGVAALKQGDDAQRLIARADAALYQSKEAGRDRVTCTAA
jgi:diguanylate cyclase